MKIQFSERLKSSDFDSSAALLSTTKSSKPSPSHAHAYRLLIFKELVAAVGVGVNKEAGL